MAEITDLQILAANNTGRAPEGWKGPAMNDAFRELEAMIARDRVDTQFEAGVVGGPSTYTLSASRSGISSYTNGLTLAVRWGTDSAAAPTINVNSLGAKTIVRQDGSAIEVGDLVQNQPVQLVYITATGKFHAHGLGEPHPDAPSYTEAGIPAAGRAGRIVLITDYGSDNVKALAYDDGSAWSYLSPYIQVETTAQRAALTGNWTGRFVIVSDATGDHDLLSYYNGSSWITIDDVLDSESTATRGTATEVGRLLYLTDNSGAANEPVLAVDCAGRTGEDWMELSDRLLEYTVAGLPTASNHPRKLVYVTNGTSGPGVAVSNGTVWKWVAATAGSAAIWQTVS